MLPNGPVVLRFCPALGAEPALSNNPSTSDRAAVASAVSSTFEVLGALADTNETDYAATPYSISRV